ncbi:unnamed protein product [Miscanthus lutarioriparius]|uniref:Glutathione transferase n=1 Tax=Miscanthus lutarioriparius TaxID=422564 RepID=A0A811ML16_9POAL|nr:unnamed protein product [Miscanthus lutarioriparius]
MRECITYCCSSLVLWVLEVRLLLSLEPDAPAQLAGTVLGPLAPCTFLASKTHMLLVSGCANSQARSRIQRHGTEASALAASSTWAATSSTVFSCISGTPPRQGQNRRLNLSACSGSGGIGRGTPAGEEQILAEQQGSEKPPQASLIAMQPVKVYADRRSQPSRAVIIFCRVNQIDFEEVTVDLFKSQHLTPEFKKVNPMGQVPAIVDGRFKLFESHAILRYLASVFPRVADHWYPADLFTRAKIESILDWHHTNLRRGAATVVQHTALAPFLGLTTSPEAVEQAEKLLMQSLGVIESVWLKGDAKFLLGNPQPSIADLSLVCEIMQLEILGDEVRDRFLGAHEKILIWMDKVRKATSPHFEEANELLFQVKARMLQRKAAASNQAFEPSTKLKIASKL